MIGLLVFILAASSVSGQFLNCPWVNSLNCSAYDPQPECGTDGFTYVNRCFFAQQQCVHLELHILHDGACLPSESSTTPAATTVSGHDAVLDFFCTVISKQDCGTEDQPVCASDNWTYKNYCEYDKARCTHRNLMVLDYAPCP
ncbi:ovomucoid-like [Ruditapes philippinarum]|uniref:ovomucoid-like n=1 Tax=Ruditapes philippinarum TaxID=129788 RepID=UPI00295B59E4|nr:ovomucoid-like [Ruditapes philippinarum]